MPQEYDVALKQLFRRSGTRLLREICGESVLHWHDKELPRVRNPRGDMIGETESGRIVHLEFDANPRQTLGARFGIYYLEIYLKFGRFPHQSLINVGPEPTRVSGKLEAPKMSYRYNVVNLWECDGEPFLRSNDVGDQILATLMRLKNQKVAVGKVVDSIAQLKGQKRYAALGQLLVISGLRRLEVTVEREVAMRTGFGSIFENKVLGREYKKGLAEGLEKGLEKGLEQGLEKGLERGVLQGRTIVRNLLVKRFGKIPSWAETKLRKSNAADLELWADRLLDSKSIRQVFET